MGKYWFICEWEKQKKKNCQKICKMCGGAVAVDEINAWVWLSCEVRVWHIWNELFSKWKYRFGENCEPKWKHMNRRSAMTFTGGHPFRYVIIIVIIILMTALNLHRHTRNATHLMISKWPGTTRSAKPSQHQHDINQLINCKWRFTFLLQILPARNPSWWGTYFQRWHRTRCHSFS